LLYPAKRDEPYQAAAYIHKKRHHLYSGLLGQEPQRWSSHTPG